jgi:hypothetical protein
MGRNSIPEYKATRPRQSYYPREAFTKRARIQDELDRMIAAAQHKGLPADTVNSIYQGPDHAIRAHEPRHGYELPWGPEGVTFVSGERRDKLRGVEWGQQIYSYRDTEVAHLAKPNVESMAVILA